MPKGKGKKRISKAQKGFSQDYVKTGNATESAMRNYKVKNRNVAKSIGSENLTKPDIIKEIERIADYIPNSLLVEKHLELLNVSKITKVICKGKETEIEESTDVQALKAGLDMAYKLKGSYAPDKNINISLTIEDLMEKNIKRKKDENDTRFIDNNQ
jgi:phage terminase small subunit